MAERVGFEPTLEFPLNTLSKRAPSTTRPSLQRVGLLLEFNTFDHWDAGAGDRCWRGSLAVREGADETVYFGAPGHL